MKPLQNHDIRDSVEFFMELLTIKQQNQDPE